MANQRSRTLRLHIFGSKVHKWLAVFVGVQALLWMATGTLMSYLKLEHVRSEHVISREPAPLSSDAALPAWAPNGGDLVSVTTKMVNARPMVELRRSDGTTSLHDPSNGRLLSPLSRETAEAIALNAWSGPETTIEAAISVAKPVGTEFSGPFPAWQVQFGDPDATRLYIDASNGALLAARSDTWRFFDFIWGLHIMDWNERHRINSWWLLLFGIGGTIISVSGFVLLANRFPKMRRPRAKRS